MNPSAALDHDRVGPYQLVKAIGAGGSARVDLARIDRAYGFQRHVVIKRPLEHLRGEARATESLRREARLGSRLRHPNLVAVLDAGVHDGYDYLVLEYVQGGSLRTLVESEIAGRVCEPPVEVALAIARDIARALHQAHELTDEHGAPLGLVHRDVSPGNVLIGLDGAVKLADFGIAKETRVATLSGSMHGTVTYMAPEQCRGHAFDRRADIFSLGVILYELITGSRLFWADNDVASLHRVLAGNVPRPRKMKPEIEPALEEIILTAVAADPGRRFATARVFADELEAFGARESAILGARHIARWARDRLGATSIGDATMVDASPVRDEPLVELIAATPAEEPPSPTFGPTNFDDPDVDTDRAEPPAHRRGAKLLIAIVAGGLAVGSAVTALVMHDSSPVQPATVAPVVDVDAAPASEASDASAVVPPSSDAAVTTPTKPHHPHHHPPTNSRPPPAHPPPPVAAGSGSAGSGSASKPPKVEWDPKMLLPTDKRK